MLYSFKITINTLKILINILPLSSSRPRIEFPIRLFLLDVFIRPEPLLIIPKHNFLQMIGWGLKWVVEKYTLSYKNKKVFVYI